MATYPHSFSPSNELSLSEPTPSTPNPPRQLDILLHNCNPLGVNGTQIRILKQMHQKRLGRLLQRLNRLTLPPQLSTRGHRAHGDFSDESRKGKFEQQQIGGALVFADLAECRAAGLITTAGAGRGVSCCWDRVSERAGSFCWAYLRRMSERRAVVLPRKLCRAFTPEPARGFLTTLLREGSAFAILI